MAEQDLDADGVSRNVAGGDPGHSDAVTARRYRGDMTTRSEAATKRAQLRDELLRRFVVPPSEPGTADERAARAREAMSGLRAGVRVTKAMYRPGR